MGSNDSHGFVVRQVEGIWGIYEIVGVSSKDEAITCRLDNLSEQIFEIAKEYVEDLPRTTILFFQKLSDTTSEWIIELDDPFGLDCMGSDDPNYEWHKEALDSGVCHTFFNRVFRELSIEKYGLAS
jgi:predicted AAA+ superfamily ATPase